MQNFGGYVRRKTNEEVEVLIVLEDAEEQELGYLWAFLKSSLFAKVGNINSETFVFQNKNYINSYYLEKSFQVCNANGINEGWSVYDEVDINEAFSLVSSIH